MSRDTSVYPRKGSPYWYVSFWCPRRMKRVHEATKFRTDDSHGRRHALRHAAALSEAAASIRGLVKHETWHAWVGRYIDDRYRRTPKTLQRFRNAWEWVATFLHERSLHAPSAITYHHVLAFVEWRTGTIRNNGKPISRNTALLEVKVWGLIMREAIRRGYAATNPCERLGIPRDPSKEKRAMSDAEIAQIRAALHRLEGALPLVDQWMTTCFEVAIHQGCRLMETQVAFTEIDLEARTIQFRGKGRGGVPRIFTTALHPGLVGRLSALREAGATHTCRLPRMAALDWYKFFQREKLEGLSFHCTRVTVVTRLARAGVPIQQAMRFVNHASAQVHAIYQKLSAPDLQNCLTALASLGSGATPQTPGASAASRATTSPS